MAGLKAPLVLLQTSDWLVGAPLVGRGVSWPVDARPARRDELDAAPERAVAAARSAGADALLVPGNLWDARTATPAAVARLLDALRSFAPKPVFVAPGLADPSGPGSFYDPYVLEALDLPPWPENVVVFGRPHWESVPFPGRDDVSVVGGAFAKHPVVNDPAESAPIAWPLVFPPAHPETPAAIVLLHGAVDDEAEPPAEPRGVPRTTRAGLAAAGFTWTALGGRRRGALVMRDGAPCAAYAGAPTAFGVDDAGPRAFLSVTIGVDGRASVAEIPSDARAVHDLLVDVTGADAPGLRARLVAALDEARATERDVVRVTVTGRPSVGLRAAGPFETSSGRVLSFVLRDRTAPPFPPDAEEPDARTAEGRFLLDLRQRAEAADEATRRLVEEAAVLGREALAGRPIEPAPLEEF